MVPIYHLAYCMTYRHFRTIFSFSWGHTIAKMYRYLLAKGSACLCAIVAFNACMIKFLKNSPINTKAFLCHLGNDQNNFMSINGDHAMSIVMY